MIPFADISSDSDSEAQTSAATETATATKTVRKKQSPEHVRLYHCFKAWVKNPANDDHCRSMRQAMDCHELNERLRRLIPSTEDADLQQQQAH